MRKLSLRENRGGDTPDDPIAWRLAGRLAPESPKNDINEIPCITTTLTAARTLEFTDYEDAAAA